MSVPAKYETTYYEVIHRALHHASELVDLAIREKWPHEELRRIESELETIRGHLTDYMVDEGAEEEPSSEERT